MVVSAVLLCLLAPRRAHAANDCPWLNEATASGVLGGVAVGSYTPTVNGKAAVCAFTIAGADTRRTLQITVEAAATAPHMRLAAIETACEGKGAPLDAIGNEAIVCRARVHGQQRSEFVAGRVRDQVFTITLTTIRKDDPVLTDNMLRMHITVAAEQVSGNLF
ncbi:MAG: hypothetical protein P4L40_26485 [Terracidiphilus sp.]|nr:hypothetical protein [Terracidiphilus sp.]